LQILLNGELYATDAKNLSELCERLGFTEARVATAVNGNFVAASSRRTTKLGESDEVEIVAPRQGG
jgi:sulfur carrier protein